MKPPFGVVDADGHINEPEARSTVSDRDDLR
jgi:hypothetical protein